MRDDGINSDHLKKQYVLNFYCLSVLNFIHFHGQSDPDMFFFQRGKICPSYRTYTNRILWITAEITNNHR